MKRPCSKRQLKDTLHLRPSRYFVEIDVEKIKLFLLTLVLVNIQTKENNGVSIIRENENIYNLGNKFSLHIGIILESVDIVYILY